MFWQIDGTLLGDAELAMEKTPESYIILYYLVFGKYKYLARGGRTSNGENPGVGLARRRILAVRLPRRL